MRARTFVLMPLLVLSLMLSACAHYRVVVPEPTPATDYETATMHAYFWGAIEDTQPTDNCLANAIDEVRVNQNLPQFLATLVTLGMWMPMRVEWRCAKPPQQEGTGF